MHHAVRHYQNVVNYSVRKAALTGKQVCMFHGGKSTGPITKDGRKRCAIAKTVHGYETRAAREYRAKKFIEMKSLFDMLKKELT